MPTQTFYNLSKEKQARFLKVAADEFCKKPYENVSINQIIKSADISRGSFYTYFENKEELVIYLLQDYLKGVKAKISELVILKSGNVFEIFIELFDYIISNYIYIERKHFIHNILTSMRFINSENDSKFSIKRMIDLDINIMNKVDKSILNIQTEEEIKYTFDILIAILKHSMIEACMKNKTKEQACEEFRIKIKLLQRGLERKEGF